VHGADVVLYGAFGGDVPHGGDVVHVAHGADVVHVAHGADVVHVAHGADVVHGGDVVHVAHGADVVHFAHGADVVHGGDVVHVAHGADVVHFAHGADVVHGGEVGQGGGVGHGITMGKLYLIKEGNGSKLTKKRPCFTVSNPFTKTDRTKYDGFRLSYSNPCISLKFSRALIE